MAAPLPPKLCINTLVCTQSPTSALSTLAASLTQGQWGQLTGVGNKGTLIDTFPIGVGSVLPFADSIPWDPINRRAYFMNSDDPGDGRRFVAYDEATNGFVTIPDIWGGGVNHIYGLLDIDIVNRRLWWGGSVGTTIGYVDLTDESFVSLNSEIPWGFVVAPALCYFPDRESVIFVDALGPGSARLWERRNDGTTWAQIGSGLNASYHAICHYNSVNKLVMFGGGNESTRAVYTLDSNGVITGPLGGVPGNVSLRAPNTVIQDNPVTGDFHVLNREGSNRAYNFWNPVTNTWATQSLAPTPNDVWQGNETNNNHLMTVTTTIPEYKVMFFVSAPDGAFSGTDITTWLYKYAT
jgi:hypothetical protein